MDFLSTVIHFSLYFKNIHSLFVFSQFSEPNVIPSRRRPRVSGSSSRYDVGDLVDINCTSAKESTPPILRWFINDREVSIIFLIPRT